MSVKRYDRNLGCMTEMPDGEYVRWEDYDATCETLAHTETERDASDAEVQRLKAEVEHLQDCLGDAHAINAKEELKTWERIENLKAEVERLRKAGDIVLLALWLGVDEYSKEQKEKAEEAWNAAKEGKPKS